MKKFIVALAAGAALSACGGGNPFVTEDDTGTDTGTGTVSTPGIDSGSGVPPGTQTPTPDDGIVRSEASSTENGETGNGFARNMSYDATTDTFTVDNLAFDGDNVYTRVTGANFQNNVSD